MSEIIDNMNEKYTSRTIPTKSDEVDYVGGPRRAEIYEVESERLKTKKEVNR